MKELKTYLNSKKIPLNLHDSLVVNYFITNEKIFFRLAVPSFLNSVFDDESDEIFYLIDFVAYEPQLIEYELTFFASVMPEIISFEYVDEKYIVYICVNGEDWNKIEFTAKNVQWLPIQKVKSEELDNIEECDFRYVEYP